MAELLPQPKGNEEQILALMAALGQHLIPDYLKNRDVQIPMTPEGMLAPNPAGKVPQLNPSPLETGTMAGIDLATMLPGGLAKPMLAAGAGAAAKPGLSGLLKQLAAQGKKVAKPQELPDFVNLLVNKPMKEQAVSPAELETALDNIMKALQPSGTTADKATKPLLTEAADIGFTPHTSGILGTSQAVVNGSPAGKIYTTVGGKFHAALDSPSGPKSLGAFASQQEAQDAIKAQLIGKPWPYKGAEPTSLTQVPYGMNFVETSHPNDYWLKQGDKTLGSITSYKSGAEHNELKYVIDNHDLPIGHHVGQHFSNLDEAKAALLESISTGKKPSLSDADIAASLAENPGASIFDVAGVPHTGPSLELPPKLSKKVPKEISITPLDWVSALGTKHAADVTLGKSPEELAALGFNPNLPLFKGGKPFYKKELPDPAAKPYERALFLADTPNVAQHYGDVLPFMARATKAGEVDWKKASGGFPHYDEPTMSAIIEAGRAQGFDLLKIKQLLDMGGKQDQYAVLHPNLLRAPHAAFDPTKLHLNNVLAGLAGAAVVPPVLKETDLINGLGWNQ